MVQVTGHLPSKHEALSSTPGMAKKRKKKKMCLNILETLNDILYIGMNGK
jgi:hypothetical protein